MRAGQIATVVLVVLAAAWVPFIEKGVRPAVAIPPTGYRLYGATGGSYLHLLVCFETRQRYRFDREPVVRVLFAIFMLILKVYVNY